MWAQLQPRISCTLLLGLLALFGVSRAVGQDAPTPRTFTYETYDVESGAIVSTATRTVEPHESGGFVMRLEWKTASGETSGTRQQTLDATYATLAWNVSDPHEDTEYSGLRDGKHLVLNGIFRGDPLEKRIKIHVRPFFLTPSVGLEGFVRSGAPKTEFRTLRPSNLSEYKMKASVQEIESITLQGNEVEVVRVKWGLTGFKSRFFSQHLWFRRSDGVFVRSEEREGTYTELVTER